MLARLRILDKEIIFPNICPNHPYKSSNAKVRVTTQVVKNPFDKDHVNKTPVTPFSYDEELFVPVCEKCAKKFDLYKKYSKWLIGIGLICFFPLILLGNFAPDQLDKLNNIWPLIVISLIFCIGIGWGLGSLANRIPRISPRYRGEKGIEIEMRCEKQYLEDFLKINRCKESGFLTRKKKNVLF